MKSKKLLIAALALSSCSTIHTKNTNTSGNTLLIEQQGSFSIGGSVIYNTGKFDLAKPLNPEGQTFHGDHAYAFYQIPQHARQYPLVFLHGAGQSKRTWETTADGREGFQNIFLKKRYSVYLVDQPRRGEAGRSTLAENIKVTPDEQFWFTQFRIGNYPAYFPNVQFPKDTAALVQFYRQMTPNTGPFDAKVITAAMVELFNKTGEGILITHSQGGGPGWFTAINSAKVKAIVSYEPYSSFVFPAGELPAPITSTGLFGPLNAVEVPLADFQKLTRIPIVVYYGDNIAKEPSKVWNMDHWRSGLEMARLWAQAINKHGGNAKVVHLPEEGIFGNTHFPFSDLNNIEVANHLEKWLIQNNLDK